jgi:CRP-like cAMP-binding protein
MQRVERADAFGVMALSVGDAMIADLVAESDCEVLLIPNALFQAVTGTATIPPPRGRDLW